MIMLINMKRLFSLIIISLSTHIILAQGINDSSFIYSFGIQGLISNNDNNPFWLFSNKYDIYNDFGSDLLGLASISKQHTFNDKISVEAGIKFVAKSNIDKSYLQEIYFNLKYGSLKLILGKQEITFSQYSEELSSGSFFVSNNSRPIPRIGIGFYDYVDVPFTNGFLQVKGFLNQGILNDDRGLKGTNRPLLHEKIFYLKSNKLVVNPYFGLNHSALFGGKHPNGSNIPVDYLSVFFGKGSKKVGSDFIGEQTNVAGAHFGLFDFGFYSKIDNTTFQGYFQKPFTDKSGINGFFKNNHDHVFGLLIKNNKKGFIEELLYENVSTFYQGGEGIPDPKIGDKVYFPGNEIDMDQIMFDVYGIEVENIGEEEFWRFIRREENYGYNYGGRDNYYNNGLYFRGWSYHEKAIASPLFLTMSRIEKISPGFDNSYDLFFVNTRITAHHLGICGSFKNISYMAKFTYTNNYGTHRGLNKGYDFWDSKNPYSDYNYFFEYGLAQYYTALDLHYTLPKNNNLVLNLSLGADFGEMYNSFGCIAGITYNGIIPTRKKSSD